MVQQVFLEAAFLWLLQGSLLSGSALVSSMNLAPNSCLFGLHLTTHYSLSGEEKQAGIASL